MTIIELGAIGELLGAIAVVATLVYLTTQIRQSARSMASQAHAQVAAEMQHNLRAMSQDDTLAIAFAKASQGQDLEPFKEVKLQFWFFAVGRGMESHVLQSRLGTLDDVGRPPPRSCVSSPRSRSSGIYWRPTSARRASSAG